MAQLNESTPAYSSKRRTRTAAAGASGGALSPPRPPAYPVAGGNITVICASCGLQNREGARFCNGCGGALAPVAAARGARKTVTIVFCDVTGSTSLGEKLDPESLRKVMSRYFEEMQAALERHGGTVEKFIGDAVMAVFGLPQVHEDDALRAVRAAGEMREALAELNKELERDRGVTIQARIGVHTGEVVVGDAAARQAMISGDAGNVAARLEQAAAPGEVLISEATRRLVRDAILAEPVEPLPLKGKTELVPAFRLLEVHPDSPGHIRHLDSPMIGRERETALLRQAFDRTVSDRACHLFTVLGAAGVGKSRLAEEFLGGIAEQAVVLQARCLPYGEAIALWPLVQVIRGAAGLDALGSSGSDMAKLEGLLGDEPDAHRVAVDVAGLVGAVENSGALSREENFWAVRRLFETIARRRQLVLVFDDLHWAEPTLCDVLDSITDLSQDAPILLLCMTRPELLDARPGWAGGKFNATSMLLEPLPDELARELLVNLVGRGELPGEVTGRLLAAAEGNPLFVEETLEMLMDEGILDREDGKVVVVGEMPELVIPPTIRGLLAARLDLLPPAERDTLERASIAGKVFYPAAVRALGDDGGGDAVLGNLASLTKKQLVAPERSDLRGEEAFRFRHILIRDAAYATLAKESRADLHERFATWLEQTHGQDGSEVEELAGYHLDRAFRYLEELGPVNEPGRRLGARAIDRLLPAGRRALAKFDVVAAEKLLSRADELMAEDDPRRPEMLLELGDLLTSRGELARAAQGYTRAETLARDRGRTDLEGRAAIAGADLRSLLEPEGGNEALRETAERWLPIFEGLEDDRGLAAAYRGLASADSVLCRWAASGEELYRAAEHARAAGDRVLECDALVPWVASALLGPNPRAEIADRVDEYRARMGEETPWTRRWLVHFRAHLAALDAEIDESRRLHEEAQALARATGDLFGAWAMFMCMAGLEESVEDWQEAGAEYRRGMELELESGDVGHASTSAAQLARTLAMEDRVEEALELADDAERLGASDDIFTQAILRQARALSLARRGEFAQAESQAREALTIVLRTDMLGLQADVLADLAFVLALAGRQGEAAEALRQAIALHERKGDRARLRRETARLQALGSAPESAPGSHG